MSRKEKRLDKVRGNVRNTALGYFEALIGEYGYIDRGGKHPKAIIGNHTLPYKRESPVKACYVTELISIIDSL
jgi:hypothetical protein